MCARVSTREDLITDQVKVFADKVMVDEVPEETDDVQDVIDWTTLSEDDYILEGDSTNEYKHSGDIASYGPYDGAIHGGIWSPMPFNVYTDGPRDILNNSTNGGSIVEITSDLEIDAADIEGFDDNKYQSDIPSIGILDQVVPYVGPYPDDYIYNPQDVIDHGLSEDALDILVCTSNDESTGNY